MGTCELKYFDWYKDSSEPLAIIRMCVQLNERLEGNTPPYADNVLEDIAACIRRGDDYDHVNVADVSKKVLDLMDVGL
jgi:hypothetical protein